MAGKYELRPDSWNRVQADISEDMTVGIKVLSATEERRIVKRTHAYCVLDLRTSIGVLRIRDIHIQWSEKNQRHFVRWRQWPTGRKRDGRLEYLDVAGPLDAGTRKNFEETILDVFAQIMEQAAAGTLGHANPQLQELKDKLALDAVQGTDAAVEAAAEETIEADQPEA